MYAPHLTKKRAKELTLKKAGFLLTLPTKVEEDMFYVEEGFTSFKNYCPLCELYLKDYCSDECPIAKNGESCYTDNSLYNIYLNDIEKNKGLIFQDGLDALKRLIKIVEDWEI